MSLNFWIKLRDLNIPFKMIVVSSSCWITAAALLFAHFYSGADVPADAAVFVAIFCGLFLLASTVFRFRNITIGFAIIAALFFAWMGLGLFGSWHQAKHEMLCLLAAGAIAGLGDCIGHSPGGLRHAWVALTWTFLAFALTATLSFVFQLSETRSLSVRLGGAFNSPNTAATLLGVAALIGASKILVRFQNASFAARTRSDRITRLAGKEFASIALVMIAIGGLLFTVSRAGIIFSLLAAFSLAGFELSRMRRRGQISILRSRGFAIGSSVLAAFVMLLAISGEINPNVDEALLENSSGRLETFSIYWNVFLEKPWFGHGLGSFNAINDQITTLENAATLQPLGAVHNVILQWLVQQGIMGVLAMTFVFGVIFYPIIRALTLPSTKPRNFLRVTIAITFLVFAHGMVDYALEIPSVMWTYSYILGLAAGYASMIQVRPNKSEE